MAGWAAGAGVEEEGVAGGRAVGRVRTGEIRKEQEMEQDQLVK